MHWTMTVIGGVIFLLCFFVSPLNANQLPNLRNEKICPTMDIRSMRDIHRLVNCTVIEGNLQLAMMSIPQLPRLNKAYFPMLREITGYLLVYYIMNLHSLAQLFPNLVVIRGQQLLMHYALVLKETQFRAVGLPSLREISHGGVRLEYSPQLCYVSSIDWTQIVRHRKGEVATDYISADSKMHLPVVLRQFNTRSLCLDTCDAECPRGEKKSTGRRLCWSQHQCQSVCSMKCRQLNLACQMGNVEECCDPECLGGCSGPSSMDCVACKHVLTEGRCASECPPDLLEHMQRRCIRPEQCIALKQPPPYGRGDGDGHYSIYGRSCVRDCPPRHARNPTTGECVPCGRPNNISCPHKICSSMLISTVKDLDSIRGCYSVHDLFISLNAGDDNNVQKQLEDAFSDLQVVEKSLRVVRSKNLLSLSFLRGLQRVGGVGLPSTNIAKGGLNRSGDETVNSNRSANHHRRSESYALEIVANEYLRELWSPNDALNRVFVESGEVYIALNRHLCPNIILQFVNDTLSLHRNLTNAEVKVIKKSNGDLIPCDYVPIELEVRKLYQTSGMLRVGQVTSLNFTPEGSIIHIYYRPTTANVTHFDNSDSCGDSGWTMSPYTYTNSLTEFVSVNNLKPATRYAVYAEIKDIQKNQLALSNVTYFTTRPSNPSVPRFLRAKAVSSREVHLEWYAPAEPNGVVTRYFIWYRQLPLDMHVYHFDLCDPRPDIADGESESTRNDAKDSIFVGGNGVETESTLLSTASPMMSTRTNNDMSTDDAWSDSPMMTQRQSQVLLQDACKQCREQCATGLAKSSVISLTASGQEDELKLIARRPVILNPIWNASVEQAAGPLVTSPTHAPKDGKNSCPLRQFAKHAIQEEQDAYVHLQNQLYVRIGKVNNQSLQVLNPIGNSSKETDSESVSNNNPSSSSSDPMIQFTTTKLPPPLYTNPPAAMQRVEVIASPNARNYFILTNLQQSNEYSIEVQACQDYEAGQFAKHEASRKQVENMTDINAPAVKKYLMALRQNENRFCSDLVAVAVKTMPDYTKDTLNEKCISVNVGVQHIIIHWSAPPNPNGVVLNYQLRYRRRSLGEVEQKNTSEQHWTTQCVKMESWRNYAPQYRTCVPSKQRLSSSVNVSAIPEQENMALEMGGAMLHLVPGLYEFQISARTLAHNDTWTSVHSFLVEHPVPMTDFVLRVVLTTLSLVFLLVVIILISVHVYNKRKLTKSLWVSQNPTYCDLYEIDAWELDYKDVDPLNWSYPLGKGSFGLVYRGVLRRLTTPAQQVFGHDVKDIPVAIKTMSESRNPNRRRDFINEACYMKQCCSGHIVQLLGVVSKIPSEQREVRDLTMPWYRAMWLRVRQWLWDWLILTLLNGLRMRILAQFSTLWTRVTSSFRKKDAPEAKTLVEKAERHHLPPFRGPNFATRMDDSPLIVMEFMPLGDLAGYLRRLGDEGTGCVDARQALLWAAQIADGMAFLEASVLVHRDLAARNCMIDQNMVAKVGDFGLARDIKERLYYRKNGAAEMPIRWMSPEAIRTGTSTHKSDVWAYGVVLWEIAMFASLPYRGMSQQEVAVYVMDGCNLFSNGVPAKCPPILSNIMTKCWMYNPWQRPTFMQILEQLEPYVDTAFRRCSFYHNRPATQPSRYGSEDLQASEYSSFTASDDEAKQFMPKWSDSIPMDQTGLELTQPVHGDNVYLNYKDHDLPSLNSSEGRQNSLVRRWAEQHCFISPVGGEGASEGGHVIQDPHSAPPAPWDLLLPQEKSPLLRRPPSPTTLQIHSTRHDSHDSLVIIS